MDLSALLGVIPSGGLIIITGRPMVPQDEELILKAKAGDKQAFTELFNRYRKKILSYLYRCTGDYQLAEDVTIDTFLNAYTSLGRYEEMGTFSSWLFKIATNRVRDELRKLGRVREEILPQVQTGDAPEGISIEEMASDESTRPDYAARKNELAGFIERVFLKLDKKYREALLLCDVEGMGLLKAAKVLNCNPITVGTRLRRARRIFYGLLKKYGY